MKIDNCEVVREASAWIKSLIIKKKTKKPSPLPLRVDTVTWLINRGTKDLNFICGGTKNDYIWITFEVWMNEWITPLHVLCWRMRRLRNKIVGCSSLKPKITTKSTTLFFLESLTWSDTLFYFHERFLTRNYETENGVPIHKFRRRNSTLAYHSLRSTVYDPC